MRSAEDIRPISELTRDADQLLDQINDARRPIYITKDGKARAVLMDPRSYDEMRQSLGILKMIAQGERDVQNGLTQEQSLVFESIAKRLSSRSPHT